MTITEKHKKILRAELCPYCDSSTETTTETEIYGREYKGRSIIKCTNYPNCDAYVGTHEDGEPLGRLADKELRNAKRNAHDSFDRIWKEKLVNRSALYKQLSEHLNIPAQYTHIGMFSKKTCLRVDSWAKQKYNSIKNQSS